ncbi:hypothetical protein GQ607_001012 [Colletotrichum asianum]|uniref:CorA-like transporter domain-containing protein n=1 Tax=Colletotrichum asianum TaxID=702518 RepID=A0A8H3WV62_9PEZI|nr:hypothetical protein GQ607_001012 [Colletotrichum asianum]
MASPSPLPADFQASYNNRDSYPRNLLQKSISSYPIALTSYAKRLDEHANYLCEVDIERVEVCFRDLKANNGAGKDIAKRNIHSPKILTEWLGVRHLNPGPQNQLLGVVEKDPKCRFVFDVVGGNALWIVTKGGLDIQDRFKELTGKDARPEDKSFGDTQECFRSSLSAHLMFCHWSTEDWRGYIKWLEYVIDMETKMAVLAPTSNGYHFTVYTAADIQRFLGWQEKISEAIAMLESNIEVMKSLVRFYTKLEENRDFDLRLSCTDDIEEFCNQLCNMVNDFTLQISRARALVKLTGDRGELIKQHRLERLNQNMEREAIMVRIVTIVTLIYLPATFVSTFFSTDIIKYQGQDSPQGNFSPVAMERWLQVTLPLTSITLLIAYYGNKWAERRSGRRMLTASHLSHSTIPGTEHRPGLGPSLPSAGTLQLPSRVHRAWRLKIWGANSIPLVPVKSTSFTASQIV